MDDYGYLDILAEFLALLHDVVLLTVIRVRCLFGHDWARGADAFGPYRECQRCGRFVEHPATPQPSQQRTRGGRGA